MFLELVKKRKSVRGYSSKPVEKDKLDYVLECARLAPSAENKQVSRFVVVGEKEKIRGITDACPFFNSFLSSAPILIVACSAQPSTRHNEQDYYLVDVGIAVQHLVLAATEKKLGTCWIAAFDEPKVKEILNMPENVRVVAITPLGYPEKERITQKALRFITKLRRKKKLGEIVFKEKWD